MLYISFNVKLNEESVFKIINASTGFKNLFFAPLVKLLK